MLIVSVLGGVTLLLVLPASAFEAIVPALVLLPSVLLAVQPALSRRRPPPHDASAPDGSGRAYGGYFGAGHGVMLIALLGLGVEDDLKVVDALKNATVTAANTAAALVFVSVAELDRAVVLLIALGSVLGGQVAAPLGRRLPAPALRVIVVALGLLVTVRLIAHQHPRHRRRCATRCCTTPAASLGAVEDLRTWPSTVPSRSPVVADEVWRMLLPT